ncbi:MAG: ATP-dependent zinc protease family protein [Acidiferrobacterales bacterium]
MAIESRNFPVLGWNEWVALPDLKVPKIKCKVDTGARTSALHAFYVEEFEENSVRRVRFGLHPEQGNTSEEIYCVADVVDNRNVTDSGGHTESRIVIQTPIIVGNHTWPIEITLTNRDTMRYRMLLGRAAIEDNFIVDAGASCLMGVPSVTPSELTYVSRRHDEEE